VHSSLRRDFAVAGAGMPAVLFILLVLTGALQAQTFRVLHNFTGGPDGAVPNGLITDRNGKLYGTTTGSNPGKGIVYELSPRGSGWVVTPLYRFQGGNDGSHPGAAVTVAADGTLFGTTIDGGGGPCNSAGHVGCGTVFHLRPRPSTCQSVSCPWIENVIYAFQGVPSDLQYPYAEATFDQSGALYGTASDQASGQGGGVYKLTPSQGSWIYSIIHNFAGENDGAAPYAGVVLDQGGNVYGTTSLGGSSPPNGTIFELSPSGSGWNETILYNFQGQLDGGQPYSALTFDAAGNLYGATTVGGQFGSGSVFQLSSGNGFQYSVLYNGFLSAGGNGGPQSRMVMDRAGNIYGTQYEGGPFDGFVGLVFKLTPTANGWTFTDLHDFDSSDGEHPSGSLVLDGNGNLYGTAQIGGTFGEGVIWEITP